MSTSTTTEPSTGPHNTTQPTNPAQTQSTTNPATQTSPTAAHRLRTACVPVKLSFTWAGRQKTPRPGVTHNSRQQAVDKVNFWSGEGPITPPQSLDQLRRHIRPTGPIGFQSPISGDQSESRQAAEARGALARFWETRFRV